MRARFARAALAVMILLSPLSAAAPRAEVAELHMATQYGIGTLAMVLVDDPAADGSGEDLGAR